jgi:hypothetical protein
MPDFDWRLGVRMLGYGALLAFSTVDFSGGYGWWTDWLQAPLVAVVLGDILWQLSGIMRRRRPTRAEVGVSGAGAAGPAGRVPPLGRGRPAGLPPCPPELAERVLGTMGEFERQSEQRRRDSEPTAYTFAEFKRSWDIACVDAWEAKPGSSPTITLPHWLLPNLAAVQNQINGEFIDVQRTSWSPFGSEAP